MDFVHSTSGGSLGTNPSIKAKFFILSYNNVAEERYLDISTASTVLKIKQDILSIDEDVASKSRLIYKGRELQNENELENILGTEDEPVIFHIMTPRPRDLDSSQDEDPSLTSPSNSAISNSSELFIVTPQTGPIIRRSQKVAKRYINQNSGSTDKVPVNYLGRTFDVIKTISGEKYIVQQEILGTKTWHISIPSFASSSSDVSQDSGLDLKFSTSEAIMSTDGLGENILLLSPSALAKLQLNTAVIPTPIVHLADCTYSTRITNSNYINGQNLQYIQSGLQSGLQPGRQQYQSAQATNDTRNDNINEDEIINWFNLGLQLGLAIVRYHIEICLMWSLFRLTLVSYFFFYQLQTHNINGFQLIFSLSLFLLIGMIQLDIVRQFNALLAHRIPLTMARLIIIKRSISRKWSHLCSILTGGRTALDSNGHNHDRRLYNDLHDIRNDHENEVNA